MSVSPRPGVARLIEFVMNKYYECNNTIFPKNFVRFEKLETYSCIIEGFVEARLCKLCVVLDSMYYGFEIASCRVNSPEKRKEKTTA